MSGCCTSCKGTGSSYDVETNGQCWDCYGTGHLHIGPCDYLFERRCDIVFNVIMGWLAGGIILAWVLVICMFVGWA